MELGVVLRGGALRVSPLQRTLENLEEEKARIEAEYREVLKSAVKFEKKIRDRWRQKSREKNARIRKLEARITDLEQRLRYALENDAKERGVADRRTKENKLLALMVRDLGIADVTEPEMARMEKEVRDLPEEDLDRTLASRLDLPYPVDPEVMDRVLSRVEEPERLSQEGTFTGAPDMSHEPRPEERSG